MQTLGVLTSNREITVVFPQQRKRAYIVSKTFAKPPLVELMAEVRWGLPSVSAVQPAVASASAAQVFALQQMQFIASTVYEPFFEDFAKRARELGFTIGERTVPAQVLAPLHKAVWRWRNPDAPGTTLQLGPGVFTINGAPPTYIRWADFVGTVSRALDALIESLRTHPHPVEHFTQLLMRYVDLFDEQFTAGMPHASFLRDVLGVDVVLPKVMTEKARSEAEITASLSVAMPVEGGNANFVFTPGVLTGRAGFILDSTVTVDDAIAVDRGQVVEKFNRTHDILNSIFVGVTAPIHHRMEPTE